MADEYVYLAQGVSIKKLKVITKTAKSVWCEVTKIRVLRMNDDMTCETEKYQCTEKYRRASRHGHFFDTWAEARDFLDERAAKEVAVARKELAEALRIHEHIAALREP
jgi:hypothetical protein